MFQSFVNSFLKEEDGQDLVEYSLLLAFIGLAATAVLTNVKGTINKLWTAVNSKLNVASTDASS